MPNINQKVSLLQENLLLIRRCLGWSAAEFGDRIGVVRQTFNNLETNRKGKFNLSKTQYLAIRQILNEEITESPDDTEMIQTILEILVDHPEEYSDEDKERVREKANMLAPSIITKVATREAVSKDWMKYLKIGALGASVMAIVLIPPVRKAVVKMAKNI